MKIRVVWLLVLVFLTAFSLFYNADVVECSDQKEGEKEGNGDTVFIKDITITGNTVIDSETLNKLVEPYKNKDLSMEEMSKVTDLITVTYQEKGYILARAYLPEQEIKDGFLKITVAEGKIGKIRITGNRYYKDDVLKRYFEEQQELGVVKESLLEKGLLLSNDIAEVKTEIMLKGGEKPGTVDVVLNAKETPAIAFGVKLGVDYNNFGSERVSEDRYGSTLKLIDYNWGSVFTLRSILGNSIDDSMLNQAEISIPINKYGTKFSFSYLKGSYAVGMDLADLGLLGRTRIYGGKLTHPLIKTRDTNLSLTVGMENKYIENELLGAVTSIDEMNIYYGVLSFDSVDKYLGKSIISLGGYSGKVEVDPEYPTSRLDSDEFFSKFNLNAVRIQKVYGNTNLLVRGTGYWTKDRLLPVEETIIGGYGTVRGHDPSLYLGDKGYVLSAELMMAPPYIENMTLFGQKISQLAQIALFYDHGGVFIVDPIPPDEQKSEYLGGYGWGIRLYYKDTFSFKYDMGFPVSKKENGDDYYHYFQASWNFF
ncbi:MAG: POTRA domain-containing protein [Desulfobacterales bacterium]|nr:POTRA domain-containing protein [Desulfobacterales bacterium]